MFRFTNLLLGVVLVLCWCGPTYGQGDPVVEITLEQIGTADPNGTARVRVSGVMIEGADPLTGFFAGSVALQYDSVNLAVSSVLPIGGLAQVNGGTGPEFFLGGDRPEGHTIGFLTELIPPWDEIPAPGPIIEYVFAVSPTLAGQTTQVTSVTFPGMNPPFASMLVGIIDDGLHLNEIPVHSADFTLDLVVSEQFPFERGDVELDGDHDLQDVLAGLNHLFLSVPALCVSAIDANGDGNLNLLDPIWQLSWLFVNGPEPAAPFGQCGNDDMGMDCAPGICP